MKKRIRIRLPLVEHFPELAEEMKRCLREEGRPELAEQVDGLVIRGRCGCGDGFCATFYTLPPADKTWDGSFETVPLEEARGIINVDVRDGRISAVEVLNREDVRRRLLELLSKVPICEV